MAQIQFPDFMAVTFGLVTYLLGEAINNRVALLRRFSIPDAVTGGLLVALVFFALHEAGIAEVSFDTHARDLLLLVFFTGIGLNARVTDLVQGKGDLARLSCRLGFIRAAASRQRKKADQKENEGFRTSSHATI